MGRDYQKNKRGGGGKDTKPGKEAVPDIPDDDPVLKMFGEISLYLDKRHDKKERIVKVAFIENLS